jgi:hypothetical protein
LQSKGSSTSSGTLFLAENCYNANVESSEVRTKEFFGWDASPKLGDTFVVSHTCQFTVVDRTNDGLQFRLNRNLSNLPVIAAANRQSSRLMKAAAALPVLLQRSNVFKRATDGSDSSSSAMSLVEILNYAIVFIISQMPKSRGSESTQAA